MNENRRSYILEQMIVVNGLQITEVIIDSHVDKHSDHISDELILSLVKLLDGNNYISSSKKEGFSYFVTNIKQQEHMYRVVWLQEEGCLYIGIITAFRDKGVKS